MLAHTEIDAKEEHVYLPFISFLQNRYTILVCKQVAVCCIYYALSKFTSCYEALPNTPANAYSIRLCNVSE